MFWYDDSRFVRVLPPAYRLLARYCRLTTEGKQSHLISPLAVFRGIVRLRQALGLAREVVAPVGDLRVALDLSDPRAGLVYTELAGIRAEARLLRRLLNPGDTFVDIGANHGSYALLAATLVGRTGSVLAFEPQPRLARLIAKSFVADHLTHARVINVALSDGPGRATLHVPLRNSGAASLFKRYIGDDSHRCIDVRCVRLDDLDLAPAPTGHVVVNIDIEGSERQCLCGAKAFIERYQPTLICELNAEGCAAGGYTTGELLALLRTYGYTRFAELESFLACGESSTEFDVGFNCNFVALQGA